MTKHSKHEAKEDPIDRLIDEPVARIRGVDALIEAVRAEAPDEFPMDRQGINYTFGDIEIEDGEGGYVPVRELTDGLVEETFADPRELLLALGESLKESCGVSLLLERVRRADLRDAAA